MGNTIYAAFADSDLAERAAGALLDFGAQPDDISLVQGPRSDVTVRNFGDAPVYGSTPEVEALATHRLTEYGNLPTSDMTAPAATIGSEGEYVIEPAPVDIEDTAKHGITTTTPQDAEAGAMTGAAWGAGVGVIAALASLAIPGFGLVAGGGALAIAIGGIVASAGAGAAAGAVTGYLKDQGVDGHVAEHYQRSLSGGGALLAVTVPTGSVGEFEARSMLEKYGASNVNVYATRGYLA